MEKNQMILFGAPSAIDVTTQQAVCIKPKYKYQKVKVGKKWVVQKDSKDNPLILHNAAGEPVIGSEVIQLLPRSSSKTTDLKDVTGLSGQGLMLFERETRDKLADEALAELTKLRANGSHTFYREVRNKSTGAITLTFRPVFAQKTVSGTSDEELIAEMKKRGYTIAPQAELPLPEKKGKK